MTISEILLMRTMLIIKKYFLSDKVKSTNRMLIDKEEIIAGNYNTAKILNIFFYIVSNVMSQNIQIVNLLLTTSIILF